MCSSKKRQPLPLSPHNYPLHGSEVNGAHPAGFHSGSSSFGVPNHTPPIASTETFMGKSYSVCRFLFEIDVSVLSNNTVTQLNADCDQSLFLISAANRPAVPGSSGDEIGKALASVSTHKLHIYTLFTQIYVSCLVL